jgi:hypothetical protein
VKLNTNDRGTAGIDKPWYIAKSWVTSALESRGFSNIIWYDSAPTVTSVNVQQINSGSPNAWLSATYSGTQTDISIPSQVKWVALYPVNPARTAQSQPGMPVADTKWMQTMGIASLAIGIVLLLKRGKRRSNNQKRP